MQTYVNVTVQLFSWIAIFSGSVSAWLWYRASVVQIFKGDPQSRGGFFVLRGQKQLDVESTAAESATANKHAAIATAVAVLMQALAALFAKVG